MSTTQASKKRSFVPVKVSAAAVLESWRGSLFSFEWLDKDGSIRAAEDMPLREREKRDAVLTQIQNGEALDLPVLGIGMNENIEIGSGKAVFLTLAAKGQDEIEVLIPSGAQDDFKSFLV